MDMADINCFEILQQMFPNKSQEQIREIIQIVEESNPYDSLEGKIENMVNILTGDGAQGPMPNIPEVHPHRTVRVENNTFQNTVPRNDQLYQRLLEFFENISPEYLLRYCREKPPGFSFDEAIYELSSSDYEKVQIDPNTIWEQLQSALPSADPDYLRKEAYRLSELSQEAIDDFVQEAIEKQEYPTMEDYLKRMKVREEVETYTASFDLETFLKMFPDPDEIFSKPEKQRVIDENAGSEDVQYALRFLYNKYRFVRKHSIDLVFDWKKKNLYQVCEQLERLPKQLRICRPVESLGETSNIPLLQLITYLENKELFRAIFEESHEEKEDLKLRKRVPYHYPNQCCGSQQPSCSAENPSISSLPTNQTFVLNRTSQTNCINIPSIDSVSDCLSDVFPENGSLSESFHSCSSRSSSSSLGIYKLFSPTSYISSVNNTNESSQKNDNANSNVAYLDHRKQLKNFIKMKDENYRRKKEEAALYDLLETCQCCFGDELIPEECFFCQKGCVFCFDCVKRGAETVIGKGDLRFPCYNTCDAEFSLQTLQMVLPENTFKHLAQRIASEEIKNANIEGLETCPFCGFAMILTEMDKIIKCNNIDCMKESCRECRHKSHIPKRCNEIEYDEDVRRRTYIENKMTEALTRTCHSCHKIFIKSSGCNKMTCTCGAMMCYICSQPVKDYTHFGDNRCPLHTNDAEINLNRILENAQRAKQDLGNVEIKFDPSRNIREFYN